MSRRDGTAGAVTAWWAVAAVLLLSGAPAAHAQMDSREAITLQNQILELRRDLQQLRDQGGAQGGGAGGAPPAAAAPSGGAPSDIAAQLLDRVTQLEDAVRQLRGHIDEVDNARQRQFDELNKRIGDLEFRAGVPAASAPPPGQAPLPVPPLPVGNLAAQAPAAPGPAGPVAPPGPVRRTPEIALQEGNAALARKDYAGAEAIAREILAGGKGPRTTDAQYLLAQSLAGRRDYQGAAVAFDDAYSRNPKGSRAPDSLLGLANSLSAINERKAACVALDKLRAEFPTIRQELRPLVAASRQRAGCA